MLEHDKDTLCKQGEDCQEYLEKIEVSGRYYQNDFWDALKWTNFC